jgi:hypothetical protein
MKPFHITTSNLENIYFASGIIIGLAGFFLFKKVKLIKKQRAAEQIRFYQNEIVESQKALSDALKTAGITPIKIETKEFNLDDILNTLTPHKGKKYHNDIKPFIYKYSIALNCLEKFAAYFIEEAADERVAYESVGPSFCYSVESCSYALCMLSEHEHKRYFTNTIKLYNIWADRLENAEKKAVGLGLGDLLGS